MHVIRTTAISVLAATAVACTTNPFTGEEQASKTATYAALGAGVAAAIAYIDNKDADRRKRQERVLKAAGVGALIGGGVGYYMDQQEAKLREELKATGVQVARDGDNLILVMPGNITFDTGKSDLQQDFQPILGSVSKVLEEYEKTVIEIAGHTDSVGSDSFNQNLSEQRARQVASFLASNGVRAERLVTVGYGESRPIADNGTPEGRSQNRRAELTLIPVVDDGTDQPGA